RLEETCNDELPVPEPGLGAEALEIIEDGPPFCVTMQIEQPELNAGPVVGGVLEEEAPPLLVDFHLTEDHRVHGEVRRVVLRGWFLSPPTIELAEPLTVVQHEAVARRALRESAFEAEERIGTPGAARVQARSGPGRLVRELPVPHEEVADDVAEVASGAFERGVAARALLTDVLGTRLRHGCRRNGECGERDERSCETTGVPVCGRGWLSALRHCGTS